jgi:rsbT co-antagonist protein RsbR
MSDSRAAGLATLLRQHRDEILKQWVALQQRDLSLRNNLLKQGELEQQCAEFLDVLTRVLESNPGTDVVHSEAWRPVRDNVSTMSRSRARQGFTPTETATFIFSLKNPVFSVAKRELAAEAFADELWHTTTLLDALGLLTAETYQKGREEIIARQQQELMELSTPVVELWEGVLALPLIGTLDSARTQVVMESLLQAIVDTGSSIAIIDITGVGVVDTLVAQHLLKTVAAARLMGADCIISGIRPQIAQTIVHLGVEINDVITKATLADAFAIALSRAGLTISSKVPARRAAFQES